MAISIAVWVLFPSVQFVWEVSQAIEFKQRVILYHVDHERVAAAARALAARSRSEIPERWPSLYLRSRDQRIPPVLAVLKPSGIHILRDRVEVEFGGALEHFGIAVFPDGEDGYGLKRLGDGIWYYSETGRIPED